jgi:hypothetical protein
MFEVVERPYEHIFFILSIEKKRLWWNRLCDVKSSLMTMVTLKLPSERLKIRLWWCRWSDVSWCRKAIRTHFLLSGDSKNTVSTNKQRVVQNFAQCCRDNSCGETLSRQQHSWCEWDNDRHTCALASRLYMQPAWKFLARRSHAWRHNFSYMSPDPTSKSDLD